MSTEQYLSRLLNPAPGFTEADIQSDIKGLLIAANITGDSNIVKLEEPVKDGTHRRIDIAIGSTVIEVKKKLQSVESNKEEINQLSGYLKGKIRQESSRYNGILTDGINWWLFELLPGKEEIEKQAEFTLNSQNGDQLVSWMESVLAIPAEIVPTAATIEQYLGANSAAYAQDSAYLKALYEESKDNKTTKLKRELWARLLRTALGSGFSDTTDLFIDHTLLVIEALIIGHAVLEVPISELKSNPEVIITGQKFEKAGLHNFMEAGFFDWIKDTSEFKIFLNKIIERIGMFSWENVEHDILKVLYESIIRADSRKRLGEYYTPDYLAQGVIANTVTNPLEQRILDPACGSGTFIFHAIRLIISEAEKAGYDARETLNVIQNNVFGLDIHPVSILLARITYLLALGGLLLDKNRPEIWAQIYLGDSIQWHQPDEVEADQIRINTESDAQDITVEESASTLFSMAKTLVFPIAGIQDARDFDRLIMRLTAEAKKYNNLSQVPPNCERIIHQFGVLDKNDVETLQNTFNLLCELNATGRDSIWGYYVRNQIRPVWLSMPEHKVDVLVGNPPWVAYRYMTKHMQQLHKAFSQDRGLWGASKLVTQQDLVSLFVVRSAEKYLKNGGKFGYVVPNSVLSRGQYETFRSGKWGKYLRCEFTEVWDMDGIRPHPFPVPAGVVFGRTSSATEGVELISGKWVDHITKFSGRIIGDSWDAISSRLEKVEAPAVVSNFQQSPYRKVVTNGATIFPRLLFFYKRDESKNKLGMAAGTVSLVSKRTGNEKPPWKDLKDIQVTLREEYIYDVHLGSSVVPFGVLKPWTAVLPIIQGNLVDTESIGITDESFGEWWNEVSGIWEKNKTKSSKLSLLDRLNYQNTLLKQFPMPTYRVVYPKSGTTLAAARLTGTADVIENSLYWLPARSENEALYLVGILNAPVTLSEVQQYQSRGLFGGRHFDTYVWNLPIPLFDVNNELHIRIAELARECENLVTTLDLDEYQFQKARKVIRNSLVEKGLMEKLDSSVKQLLDKNKLM